MLMLNRNHFKIVEEIIVTSNMVNLLQIVNVEHHLRILRINQRNKSKSLDLQDDLMRLISPKNHSRQPVKYANDVSFDQFEHFEIWLQFT